jgi:YidC/Oxa1 family membrane protein insertase
VNPLNPLYDAVAWVLSRIYGVVSPIFGLASGWTWALTIMLLVVLMRLIMVPLFIKQMHTTRRMTALAPQMSVLRKKYKNDKQTLNSEMMKLYQEAGVNPLMGCLPVAAQLPMFFALFSVLKAIAEWKPGEPTKYGLSETMVASAQHAKILGVTISDKFLAAGTPLHVRIVILLAVIVSMVTTYLTVRQSMKRGMMPTASPDNPMGQSQKYMAYIMPFFALSGLYWPFGLVLYWVTTNLWTLGQQYVLFRRYPQPLAAGGTAAATGAVTPALAPPRPASRLPKRLPPGSNGSSGSAPAGSGSPNSGKQPGNPAAPARPAAGGGKQQGRTARPASPGKSAGPPRPSSQGKPAGAGRPSSQGKPAGTGRPPPGKPAGTGSSSPGKPAGTARASANGNSNGNSNGSGGGILRRLGRGRAEPEPEPETPEVKLVRQQRQRQSRSKRSGKG